jgi:hypothetical protein
MDTPNIESCFKLLAKYVENEFKLTKLLASLEADFDENGSIDAKPKEDSVELGDMLQTVYNNLG